MKIDSIGLLIEKQTEIAKDLDRLDDTTDADKFIFLINSKENDKYSQIISKYSTHLEKTKDVYEKALSTIHTYKNFNESLKKLKSFLYNAENKTTKNLITNIEVIVEESEKIRHKKGLLQTIKKEIELSENEINTLTHDFTRTGDCFYKALHKLKQNIKLQERLSVKSGQLAVIKEGSSKTNLYYLMKLAHRKLSEYLKILLQENSNNYEEILKLCSYCSETEINALKNINSLLIQSMKNKINIQYQNYKLLNSADNFNQFCTEICYCVDYLIFCIDELFSKNVEKDYQIDYAVSEVFYTYMEEFTFAKNKFLEMNSVNLKTESFALYNAFINIQDYLKHKGLKNRVVVYKYITTSIKECRKAAFTAIKQFVDNNLLQAHIKSDQEYDIVAQKLAYILKIFQYTYICYDTELLKLVAEYYAALISSKRSKVLSAIIHEQMDIWNSLR